MVRREGRNPTVDVSSQAKSQSKWLGLSPFLDLRDVVLCLWILALGCCWKLTSNEYHAWSWRSFRQIRVI